MTGPQAGPIPTDLALSPCFWDHLQRWMHIPGHLHKHCRNPLELGITMDTGHAVLPFFYHCG